MDDLLVRTHVDGFIGEIELSNPPLNLMTVVMIRQLRNAIRELTRNEELRAVIVHGSSARAFSAGSDMREFEEVRKEAADKKILIENLMLRDLARIPVPTIAAIEGAALGGGFELALACDLRISGRSAKIGLPECRIGGLASNGSQRLTKLIGPARAKEMLFLGLTLTAEEALQYGVINRVADDGQALSMAREMANDIAERGPLSNKLAKMLVNAAVDVSVDDGVWLGIEAQERIFDSEDLLEGSRSFFERRSPVFKGK
jgi:enoyl-CoA hydratase/carnithine racemase